MVDREARRALLEFEIALDAAAADEVRREDWGRALLTPSLPLVWDASYLALERTGIGLASVAGLADEVLGGAGFAHRTVVVVDEAEGERLAAEAEAIAGWTAERIRYMVWRGKTDLGKGASGESAAREVSVATAEPLRRQLLTELTQDGEADLVATVRQLLERGRRQGEASAVRWFVAPEDGPGASACCLFSDGRSTGQIEDVATLEAARGNGLATAVVEAARAASREAGDTTTFITADAADWPQFLYEKLGFVAVGDLHILRRRPGA